MSVTTGRSPVRGALTCVILVVAALSLSGCLPGAGPIEDFSGVPLVAPAGESVSEGEAEQEEEEAEAETPRGEAAEEGETEIDLVELEVSEGEPRATYLEDGGRIALVLWGSSGCPPVGTAMNVVEDSESGNTVRVDLAAIPENTACTQDFVPHTTVFWTPVDIATTQPLRILVGSEEVTLPVK